MTDAGTQSDYLDIESDNRRRLLVLGGVVATVAVVGGAAWAATSFFATGAQPADALPSSTVAYASIDLDPSGSQKIEAIRTLRKFPAFDERVNLDTDDDLRELLFTEITETGECEGLDYERDVAPWLGSRAAIAAVDAGEAKPSPVGVVQVTDPDRAEDGMANLIRLCGGGEEKASPGTGPWIVAGDWVVVGESRDLVQGVVDETADGSLSDDEDFQRWTGEAGDPGIISFYAAAEAAAHFDDLAAARGSMLGVPGALGETTAPSGSMTDAIEDFEGLAMTVRFDDGALEIESATSANQDLQRFFASSVGVDLVASLPEDTVAALGLGLQDGWVEAVAEQVVSAEGGDSTVEELYEEASAGTGLDIPEDLEKLFGEGVTLALGADIDTEALANGGVLELPIGVKIKGDTEDIQSVLAKLEPQLGPDERDLLDAEASDGHVSLSPDEEFREALAQDGALGENEVFERVVEDADDAQAVFFVNFNADDDWLVRLAQDIDPEVAENLAPLAAFGISAWFEDGTGHALLKLTTD